jgi:hypothetical protein
MVNKRDVKVFIVMPQPWDQGGTSVLSAIPWIDDSTTEQNELFIA